MFLKIISLIWGCNAFASKKNLFRDMRVCLLINFCLILFFSAFSSSNGDWSHYYSILHYALDHTCLMTFRKYFTKQKEDPVILVLKIKNNKWTVPKGEEILYPSMIFFFSIKTVLFGEVVFYLKKDYICLNVRFSAFVFFKVFLCFLLFFSS